MSAQTTIDNLRRAARELGDQSDKIMAAAKALEGMSVNPGVYVVELARMLRERGLCVIERSALSLALTAMEAHANRDLDGDSPVVSYDYRRAMEAVADAIQGTYPQHQGASSA